MSRRERTALAAMTASFAVAYALVGLFKHWHYDSSAFDLGIFDQVIWRLSRFEAPVSSITNHINLVGDHFHPLLAVLTPLYWIHDSPETLIAAQSALVALSIIPVFAFARRRLSAGHAFAVAVVYGLFWGLQRLIWFDFHELAFAPLLIAVALNAIDLRRWRWLWVASIALTLTKEDLIPFVVAFGGFTWLFVDRRQGLRLTLFSLCMFGLVVFLVIPAFNAGGVWPYGSAFATVKAKPWLMPIVLVTPSAKLVAAGCLLAPFLFLPLVSRWSLLLMPGLAERFLSDVPAHWGYTAYYWAPLAPILAAAMSDVLGKFERTGTPARHRLVTSLLSVAVLVSAILPGHQPILRLFRAKHYLARPAAVAAPMALALIPSDASVVAQNAIVPHLSHRDRIYMLQAGAPDADFVVAATGLSPWPLPDSEALTALLDQRRARGYREIFSRDGWVVLQR